MPLTRHTSPSRHQTHPARGGVLLKMLLCLVCVLAMVALAWMLFLPSLVTSVLEKRTGFVVRLDSIYANPFNGQIDVRGLVLANPSGFGPVEFLNLRRLTATVDTASLFGNRPVVETGSVDIARLTVATNGQGVNNLDLLARRLAWLAEANARHTTSVRPSGGADASGAHKFSIHRLDVKLGEIVIVDDSVQPPVHRVVPLNFQHHYEVIMNGGQFLTETVAALKSSAGASANAADTTPFTTLLPDAAGQALDDAVPVRPHEGP